MTVEELMGVAKSRVIALDGMDGKKLFDTSINRKEYYKKYYSGTVISVWSEIKSRGSAYNSHWDVVLCCYISHESWKEGENI